MTFDILMNYHWQGNFPEMLYEIENAVKVKNAKSSFLELPLLTPDCLNDRLLLLSNQSKKQTDNNNIPQKEHNKSDKQDIHVIIFYKINANWKIGINGKDQLLNNINGLYYIHQILQRKKRIECIDLIKILNETSNGFNSAKVFDFNVQHTPNSYVEEKNTMPLATINSNLALLERQKNDLEEKIDSPENYNPDEILSAKEELQEVVKKLNLWKEQKNEIKNQVQIKRKNKKARSPDENKARVAVKKAIDKALLKISENITAVYEFINEHTIDTGYGCAYVPLPNKDPKFILYEPENI